MKGFGEYVKEIEKLRSEWDIKLYAKTILPKSRLYKRRRRRFSKPSVGSLDQVQGLDRCV